MNSLSSTPLWKGRLCSFGLLFPEGFKDWWAHVVLCFSVVKKVAQYMADVLEDSRDKVQENLLANGGNHNHCVVLVEITACGHEDGWLMTLICVYDSLQSTWSPTSPDSSGTWLSIQSNSLWRTSLRSSPRCVGKSVLWLLAWFLWVYVFVFQSVMDFVRLKQSVILSTLISSKRLR